MESVAQPHIKLIQISREKPRKYPAVLHSNYTLKLPGETGIILIPRSHPWLTKSGSLGLENRFPHSKWRPRDSDVQPWSRRNIQHLPQWNLFGSQRVLLKWFMSASSPISACIVQQENVTKIMVSLCLEPYFWKKKNVLSAMVRYSKDRSNLDVFVSMFVHRMTSFFPNPETQIIKISDDLSDWQGSRCICNF